MFLLHFSIKNIMYYVDGRLSCKTTGCLRLMRVLKAHWRENGREVNF